MLQALENEKVLVDQFIASLQTLPNATAKRGQCASTSHPLDRRYDAEVALEVAGKPIRVLVELKKAVYPRDVRQILWEVRERAHSGSPLRSDREEMAVLVAESISPGAKELLRAEHVGYFDSGGSLYLPAPGAFVYIEKPPPKSLLRSVRSLFSGRRAQVLHALLLRHRDWLRVKDLAEQAHVSPATASQVLSELDRFDWLDSRGQGPNKRRHLREPAALLDAWVKQQGSMRAPLLRRYFVPSVNAEGLMARIGQVFEAHEVEYAISHEAAAQRYAPFLSAVSQVRCRLIAGSAADAAIAELGARVVSEGANLAIIEAKSSGDLLFRERVGDIWLASPIQVYLDLLRGEGRAKELAEHLRQERIGV